MGQISSGTITPQVKKCALDNINLNIPNHSQGSVRSSAIALGQKFNELILMKPEKKVGLPINQTPEQRQLRLPLNFVRLNLDNDNNYFFKKLMSRSTIFSLQAVMRTFKIQNKLRLITMMSKSKFLRCPPSTSHLKGGGGVSREDTRCTKLNE